jgi:hypothetical protein
MFKVRQGQKGAALVEYAIILPLVLLLFLGTLEVFRLMALRQSLRNGIKRATPYFTHYRDYAARALYQQAYDPVAAVQREMDSSLFPLSGAQPIRVYSQPPVDVNTPLGSVFEVIAEVDVRSDLFWPLAGTNTVTIRESMWTYMDATPLSLELELPATPFPLDAGGF